MVKKRRQNNQLRESKQTKDEETDQFRQLICDLTEKTLRTEDRVFITHGFCFYVFCFALFCKLNNTFQFLILKYESIGSLNFWFLLPNLVHLCPLRHGTKMDWVKEHYSLLYHGDKTKKIVKISFQKPLVIPLPQLHIFPGKIIGTIGAI